MNYVKIYNSIIDKGKARSSLEYSEEHHIVPRCLGGSDDNSNLVLLTPEEHFLAHLLLVKMYPDNSKLVFAANMMSVTNGLQKRSNNKRYAWLKRKHQKVASENGKKNKGRKATAEQCKNISEAKKGDKNPMFGKKGNAHPCFGYVKKGHGLGKKKIRKNNPVRTPEWNLNLAKSRQKYKETVLNTKGYQILTPSGFQDFHGISYNGLVACLQFTTSSKKTIKVSTKHKFGVFDKQAKQYKVGELLPTVDGLEEITSIEAIGKRDVYDVLEVDAGHVYFANDIANHNCEIIKDENFAIIPEFNAELKAKIVREWDKAPFYDSYVSMDLGLKDLTVVLFAWFDFKSAKLIIEDEFVINGQKFNTNNLANGIKQKEVVNFTDKITGELRNPYLRVSDNNLMVIRDLWDLHGLRFLPTRKDDADAALNKVRIMLQDEQIIIHPRCTTLIMHLEAGIWNKSKTSFERSADTGHFDAVDSLKYLVRNVQLTKNPYPAGYFHKSSQDLYQNHKASYEGSANWNKVFNVNKK